MKPILLLFLLSACTPSPCPVFAVKEWSPEEQREMLTEERKLPADSILIPVVEDYAKLRREVR